MANITRIKAKDDSPSNTPQGNVKPHSSKNKKAKLAKKTIQKTNKKPLPKPLAVILAPFILISKPFRALGRYIRGSWREIRQVHWPDRKLTWKMTLSVIIYVIIFATIIMLLDLLFSFIFNQLLGA